jgi:hypothetical protein
MTDDLIAHAKRGEIGPRNLSTEEAMREALSFYADPANWRSPSSGFALQYDPEPSPVDKAGRHEVAAKVLRLLSARAE